MPPAAELVADKGYDSKALRDWLAERGTTAVIPPRKKRKVQYHYDKTVYRQRNIIERMFCRLKDWRLATRFDRNIKNFIAAIASRRHLVASPDPSVLIPKYVAFMIAFPSRWVGMRGIQAASNAHQRLEKATVPAPFRPPRRRRDAPASRRTPLLAEGAVINATYFGTLVFRSKQMIPIGQV